MKGKLSVLTLLGILLFALRYYITLSKGRFLVDTILVILDGITRKLGETGKEKAQ